VTRSKKHAGGRPLRAGAAAQPVTIRATPDERAAWERAAGDKPLGAWLRDLANAAVWSAP
jgi:hypothetical protein